MRRRGSIGCLENLFLVLDEVFTTRAAHRRFTLADFLLDGENQLVFFAFCLALVDLALVLDLVLVFTVFVFAAFVFDRAERDAVALRVELVDLRPKDELLGRLDPDLL